jgi:hypothetical protein
LFSFLKEEWIYGKIIKRGNTLALRKRLSNPPSSPFVKRGEIFLLPLEKGDGERF